MKIPRFAGYALIIIDTVLLAACSSNSESAFAPSGPSTGIAGFGLSDSFSPDKKAAESYFYVSDVLDDAVYEFDSPSYEWVGSITGIAYPKGECSRYGKHTFWVTASGSDELEEFTVGGTRPIKTLSETAGEPQSCAIDPATGDLAETIVSNGDVIIYQNASGSGTVMTTPLIEAFFAGYDNLSNLFVDGAANGLTPALVELPKGSSTFETIATSNTLEQPGGVQWDGKYLTVNDQTNYTIYRYTVSGTTATLMGSVVLRPSRGVCTQDAITAHFVYCPDQLAGAVTVYKYPAGGRRVAFFDRSFNSPVGVVKVEK
jgi:hypothetical protein